MNPGGALAQLNVGANPYTRTSREGNGRVSQQSTALLTVGPKSVAPWGDRVWRIAATAQLVEGSIPHWLVTPTHPSQYTVAGSSIEVVSPHPEAVVDSILVFLGALFGDDEVERRMLESHNLTVEDGVREVAAFYELASETRNAISYALSKTVRLGFTRLDEVSLVNHSVFESLRGMDFDLDVFTLQSDSFVQ